MGRRHAGRRFAVLAGLFASALIHPAAVPAVGPGKWTPSEYWGAGDSSRYAVHMILMAGDTATYHSRILWFRGHDASAGLKGGEWGWEPGNDGCASYPSGSFVGLNPPNPEVDIFCSGHAGLADGRIILPGGTHPQTGSYGENKSRLFTPGAGSAPGGWSDPGNLAERRWYPSATTLRDGRVTALGGWKYPQQRIHGGRIDGAAPSSPRGDTLHRFDPFANGGWDPPVKPLPDPDTFRRPNPRESHTAIEMPVGQSGQMWFGGRRGDGIVLNDLWRLERPDSEQVTADDYIYRWHETTPAAPFGAPEARAEHTAVYDPSNKQMLVFGGRDGAGDPVPNTVWRLWWNTALTPDNYQWDEVQILGGAPPAARFAHTAFFESRTLHFDHAAPPDTLPTTVNRMIVFGGAGAPGAAPTDQKLYELRLSSPSQATWAELPETTLVGVTAKPAPRSGHAAGWGPTVRTRSATDPPSHTAYIYGGEIPGVSGVAYSDTLWTLWLFHTGKYAWEMRTATGPSPGRRARFSMLADGAQGGANGTNGPRLYIFGGDSAGVLADRFVYVVDPYRYGDVPAWSRWDDGHVATTRHAAVLDRNYVHARVAEVYDPSVGQYGQWSSLLNSQLLQHTYPIVFTVSGGSSGGGRIFTPSAENDVAHYLDLPGPGGTSTAWQPLLSNGAVGFAPKSGVLYRPNRIMVAGGSLGNTVVGTTKTRDVSDLSNPWVTSASMAPRYFHNLVLLPDGKTVAVGGNGTTGSNDSPVKRPQLWDPAGNGNLGIWTSMTGPDTLSASTMVRGYHSTALLLPDGRVLCSGGEGHTHKYRADIFCPPCLFNADGSLANRPVLTSWPRRVSYGERFAVCVGTDTANIASMALIRPAAVTHGFDENQRYVPLVRTLAETASDGQQRFTCQMTADSSIAPPGDYMLFVVNAAGTPGLAQWVRVGATNGDTDRPRRVENLAPVDGSWDPADSSVTLTWSPPAEDSLGSCRGPAAKYELRYRNGATIADWTQFAAATLALNPPLPGEPGGPAQSHRLKGLQDGCYYYVRLVAKDYASGNGNWSAMSSEALVLTPSSGGGEGGGDDPPILPHLTTGESFATFDSGSDAVVVAAPTDAYGRNTLFPHASPGVVRTDRIALPHGPKWVDGRARVRVGRWGRGATRVHGVRLVAVDHAAGEAFVGEGGAVAGTRVPAAMVLDGEGRDWAANLAAGTPYESRLGDVLSVAFAEARAAYVYVRVSGAQVKTGPTPTGVDVQARVGDEWTTIGHVDGREHAADGLVSAPATSELRLVFNGNHRLHGIGRIEGVTGAVTKQVFQPVAYVDSASGATSASLVGEVALLTGGEYLLAEFAPTPAAAGLLRDWFLEADGEEADLRAASPSARIGREAPEPAAAPAVFALSAFHPNPASGSLRAEFALPRESNVRVEIFDVLGRRTATLVAAQLRAGRYPVTWDGRTTDGSRARAGVYLCRMLAGEFRARRTLVLRP